MENDVSMAGLSIWDSRLLHQYYSGRSRSAPRRNRGKVMSASPPKQLRRSRPARFPRLKVIVGVVAIAVLAAIGGGLALRNHRDRAVAEALSRGRAALKEADYKLASKSLREYLARNPADVEVLRDYAFAQLRIRPLALTKVGEAMRAYRTILRHHPKDDAAFAELTAIYFELKNYSELLHVCRNRLQHLPNDPMATLWSGKALLAQHRTTEARERLRRVLTQLEAQPDPQPEYVEACWLLGSTEIEHATADSGDSTGRALQWLDRGVKYNPKSVEALINRARFRRMLGLAGHYEDSAWKSQVRGDLVRADDLQPKDPRVRLLLAEEWIALGDASRAASELEAVDKLSPEAVSEYFPVSTDLAIASFPIAADIALMRGRSEACIELANKATYLPASRGQKREVFSKAVELYVQGGELSRARDLLEEYLELVVSAEDPAQESGRSAYLKALLAQAEGDPYGVVEVVEPALAKSTTPQPVLLRLLAGALSQTGQSRRAVRAMQEYLRHQPLDREMTMRLAREHIRRQEWPQAFRVAQLAESFDPTDIAVKLLRIGAGVRMATTGAGRKENPENLALIEELRRLREEHPDHVEIRLLLATSYISQGQEDVAEQELRTAISECSESLSAEIRLGWLLLRQGGTDESLKILEEACRRHKQDHDAWEALFYWHYARGRHQEAQEVLQRGIKAVASKWGRADLGIKLAMLEILHLDRGRGIERLKALSGEDEYGIRARTLLLGLPEIRADTELAQRLVQEIRKIEGEGGLQWRLQQAAHWLRHDSGGKRREETVELLEYCLRMDPGWSAPTLLLGRVYEEGDDLRRAEDLYERSLSANHRAVDVLARLVNLLESQGRLAEANRVLRKLDASGTPSTQGTEVATGELHRLIEELQFQVANGRQGLDSYILLAKLVYRHHRDLEKAMSYLDRAEELAPGSMIPVATRIAILHQEGKDTQALNALDALVKKEGSLQAKLLRASFLAGTDQIKEAEQAYKALCSQTESVQGFIALGSFYAETDRLDEAIKTWERGRQEFPKAAELKQRLLKAKLNRGREEDIAGATALLEELEKEFPQDPDLLMVRGSLLLREGTAESVRQAERRFEEAVALRPSGVRAHLGLIQIALLRGKAEEARELSIRAERVARPDARLSLMRARAEQALGDWETAIRQAQAALAKDPNRPQAYTLLAMVAFKSRRPEEVRSAHTLIRQEALKRWPTARKLRLSEALLLAGLGKRGEAIEKLESLRRDSGGKTSDVYLLLADLYRAEGKPERAEQLVERALEIAPHEPDVLKAAIEMHIASNSHHAIMTLIQKNLQGKPKLQALPVLVTAGSALAQSRELQHRQAAVELLRDAVALAPNLTKVHVALAALLYGCGDAEAAESAYRQVLQKDPQNPDALNGLAWILGVERDQYGQALEMADKAVQAAPASRSFRDTRGVILMNLPGRLTEAREEFQKCLDLTKPETAARCRALFRLGVVCMRLDEPARAEELLLRAERIDQTRRGLSDKERADLHRFLKRLPRKSARDDQGARRSAELTPG